MKYKKEGVDDSYLALYQFFFIISSPLFCFIHTYFIYYSILNLLFYFYYFIATATIEYSRIPWSITKNQILLN